MASLSAEEAQEDALNLLNVAHRFVFDGLVEPTIKSIEHNRIPIFRRLRLGEKYNLDEWLFSAYETLLDRHEPLNLDEVAALGPARVVCFMKARDYMSRERLEIAQENLQYERSRAQGLERQLSGVSYPVGMFGVSSNAQHMPIKPRLPTATAAVAKKFFV